MAEFTLDPRLQAATIFAGELTLSQLLLLNDSRFPWFLLIPRRDGLEEIHQLTPTERHTLADETAMVSQVLADITGARKINTGALGNNVRQLHIHVVARFETDCAWPGPVWGSGERVPYEAVRAEEIIAKLNSGCGVS